VKSDREFQQGREKVDPTQQAEQAARPRRQEERIGRSRTNGERTGTSIGSPARQGQLGASAGADARGSIDKPHDGPSQKGEGTTRTTATVVRGAGLGGESDRGGNGVRPAMATRPGGTNPFYIAYVLLYVHSGYGIIITKPFSL
jgi:hypothetical protein